MKMIFGTRIKNILYTLAVFTLILVTAAFAVTSVYAANNNNPLTITVRQTFTSSSATVYSTFTYRLESLSAGAPMPAGEFTPSETPIPAGTPIPGPSDTPIPTGTPIPGPAEAPMPAGDVADGYTFTVTGNSSVQIGPIYYSIQGTYQYRLSQIVGSGSYYTYDRRKYDIRVQVDELLDVSVVAFNEDEEKVEEILFENRYYYNG
ncbi:MAG: hypothetical protein FWH55_12155, partial [Oscillospiraceae bacterium]|nr:hypothetical protein [Oscillospiraceae bacterium]